MSFALTGQAGTVNSVPGWLFPGAWEPVYVPVGTSAYPRTMLSYKPRSYWRLNDQATWAADQLGVNFGSLVGGVTRGAAGGTADGDGAMTFNGSTGYVSVADSTSLHPSAFSLAVLVYKTADSSFQRILSGGSFPNQAYFLEADDIGGVYGGFTDSGATQRTVGFNAVPLAGNTWVHLVLSYDGATLSLYKNGALVASGAFNQSIAAGSGGLGIGADAAGGAYWNGRIDEPALFGYGLNAAQVAALYASLFQPSGPLMSVGRTLPVIVRIYDATGTAFVTSFSVLDLPAIEYSANGSSQTLVLGVKDQVTLSAASMGNVVKIAEQGGDGTVLFSGTIESMPNQYDLDTLVQIEIDPLGAELGRTQFSSNFSDPVDVAEMVRQAVGSTAHLWCTPQSCPNTGAVQSYDFNNTHVSDVLDTCKTLAGPTYFYVVEPNGCVWFHPKGAVAQYTVKQGQDYIARKTAPQIRDLRNKFTVVGGPPTISVDQPPGDGSVTLTADYSDATSIAQYGIRTIQPNPTFPDATTQDAVDAIRDTLGTLYNRVFQRITLGVANYAQRIWPFQAGGALVRYWEPTAPPQPEAITGAGTYQGPYFARGVKTDGPAQQLVLDDLPTTIDDLGAMLSRLASRIAAKPVVWSPMALNQPQVIGSNGAVTSAPDVASGATPARWEITAASILARDGSSTDYGAPSGAGVTVEIDSSGLLFAASLLLQTAAAGGRIVLDSDTQTITLYDTNGVARAEIGNLLANGISAAGWKFRASGSDATPLFDSDGLIDTMTLPGGVSSQAPGQTITATTYALTTPNIAVSFTLTRTSRIKVIVFATAKSTVSGKVGYARANLVGVGTTGDIKFGGGTGTMDVTNAHAELWCCPGSTVGALAAGTYTAQLEVKVDSAGSMYFDQGYIAVELLGH